MTYDDDELLTITREEGVTRVVIDHPPVNLIDRPLFRELRHPVRQLSDDPDTIVVVFSVEGSFLAHFDVTRMKDFPTVEPPPTELNGWHRMCEGIRTMPKATIAMIEDAPAGAAAR